MFQQKIPSYSKTQIIFNNKRKNYKPILQNKSEIFYQPESVKRQDTYISPIHNNIFFPRNNNRINTPLVTFAPNGNRNPISQNYLYKNFCPEKKREVTPDPSLLKKRNNDFYFGNFLDKMILLYRKNPLLKTDKSSDCILVKKKKNSNYLSGLRNTRAFRIKESFNIINIIYLIDTTRSMKKYEKLIYSIPTMNKEIKSLLSKDKLKIGYILYKDFYSPFNINENNKHIQIIPPSSKNINIYIKNYIKFEGGNDYSEDWANPILKINELIEGNEKANIVIHFSDANAHGSRFSEYDNKDIEENLLIKALTLCSKKKINFIGIMLSSFARKSFYECKKIYNNLRGFYDVFEINDIKTIYHDINQRIINIVNNNYNNSYNSEDDDENLGMNEIDENDFIYKNMKVVMKPIYEINGYKGQSFTFLPKKKLEGFNKNEGIVQGYIGDCYLISSILSMVGQFPQIFSYIFPNSENYNEKTKKMEMIIYKNGNPKVISFNNTYATYNDQLIFSKPLNNELYGIALEKGYAASKSEDGKIQTGYNIIDKGGFGYLVFETLLNDRCEAYISNKNLIEKYKNTEYKYKYISEEYLIPKIKKYIDLGGFITVGVKYNIIKGGHEYSLQGYKYDKNGNLYIEILNPHRSGRYAKENIYFSKDQDPDKDKLK